MMTDGGHDRRFCLVCGRSLADHDHNLRFVLPQPVLDAALDAEERASRTWGNDVLMQVRGIGSFIRILVPVSLTGGFTVSYGAWLGVDHLDLRRAWEVWDEPEYMQLRLRGLLANMLPPWEEETYGKPLDAAPRVVNEIPYATSSGDSTLQNILEHEWAHDPVLEAVTRYGG